MKILRFTTAKHPQGVWGKMDKDGKIEVLKGTILDPVATTGEVVKESDITRYLPPVDAPNVLALGRNYLEHAKETDDTLPKQPLLFIKATTSVIGHGDNIVIPAVAPDMVDYEAELVVIIGKKARNVSQEDALKYVLGYTCGHDVSARDCQRDDGQWARAKSFDTFGPMGPYVVTDIDPNDLRVQMRLNGQTLQDQSTKDMAFNVAYTISYLSHSITLLPGTAIYTGTPAGVGAARKPPVFLKPGDVCEIEIEKIGVLRNPVVAQK
jgi:2-keto-4-pentenoate hydratase/2-oxohepta-3-ene-1,7-dioic acid hydratase in catechol pathway